MGDDDGIPILFGTQRFVTQRHGPDFGPLVLDMWLICNTSFNHVVTGRQRILCSCGGHYGIGK